MYLAGAGFEHALHIRQSTTGNVITECVKVDRHLQRQENGAKSQKTCFAQTDRRDLQLTDS
jgi:hypothetical protein